MGVNVWVQSERGWSRACGWNTHPLPPPPASSPTLVMTVRSIITTMLGFIDPALTHAAHALTLSPLLPPLPCLFHPCPYRPPHPPCNSNEDNDDQYVCHRPHCHCTHHSHPCPHPPSSLPPAMTVRMGPGGRKRGQSPPGCVCGIHGVGLLVRMK